MWAELKGILCSGLRRGRQFTYQLLDERAPGTNTLDRDEALAELVRRYFQSHGPATDLDFARWSGLTLADTRRGLKAVGPRLHRGEAGGRPHWLANETLPPRQPSLAACLLSIYDEYTIGYKDLSTLGGRRHGGRGGGGRGSVTRASPHPRRPADEASARRSAEGRRRLITGQCPIRYWQSVNGNSHWQHARKSRPSALTLPYGDHGFYPKRLSLRSRIGAMTRLCAIIPNIDTISPHPYHVKITACPEGRIYISLKLMR